MAANTRGLLSSTFLLYCIIFQLGMAAGQCNLSNIVLTQSTTGKNVEGKPEYKVSVTNNCICTQSNLTLKCPGFSSVEKIDPAIFKVVNGQDCLVNDGGPIYNNDVISFNYAWGTPFALTTSASQVSCS